MLANVEVNTENRHLIVRCGEASARAVPGQFFQLLCPQTGDEQPFLRRPISLYAVDPQRRHVELLYKVAGAGTRALASLRVGDRLDMMGPLGVGFELDPRLRHIVAGVPGWRRSRRSQKPRRRMTPRSPQSSAHDGPSFWCRSISSKIRAPW
jgi:NAD(P)H-flavin reductase